MRSAVDWWSFRSQAGAEAVLSALGAVFESWGRGRGEEGRARLTARDRGWKGYERSADVCLGPMPVGLVAWGGEFQRGWSYVGISGQGCGLVDDWTKAQDVARDLPGYELKRVDLAVDRFDCPTAFAENLAAYRDGGFQTNGRSPKCQTIQGEDAQDGCTMYVGSRTSDKFFRGYEKGKQLLGAIAPGPRGVGARVMIEEEARRRSADCLAQVRDWYRLEVEFKPKTCPLPEDIIDRRDEFFAGAYPYLGRLLSDVEPQPLVLTRVLVPQVQLALAVEWLRRQGGTVVETMLAAYGGDEGRVIREIRAHKLNRALVEAGVLTVDH